MIAGYGNEVKNEVLKKIDKGVTGYAMLWVYSIKIFEDDILILEPQLAKIEKEEFKFNLYEYSRLRINFQSNNDEYFKILNDNVFITDSKEVCFAKYKKELLTTMKKIKSQKQDIDKQFEKFSKEFINTDFLIELLKNND